MNSSLFDFFHVFLPCLRIFVSFLIVLEGQSWGIFEDFGLLCLRSCFTKPILLSYQPFKDTIGKPEFLTDSKPS